MTPWNKTLYLDVKMHYNAKLITSEIWTRIKSHNSWFPWLSVLFRSAKPSPIGFCSQDELQSVPKEQFLTVTEYGWGISCLNRTHCTARSSGLSRSVWWCKKAWVVEWYPNLHSFIPSHRQCEIFTKNLGRVRICSRWWVFARILRFRKKMKRQDQRVRLTLHADSLKVYSRVEIG